MTYRQIIAALRVGDSHQFETMLESESAAKCACRIYGRRFTRRGLIITRIE